MQQSSLGSLWQTLCSNAVSSDRFIRGARAEVALIDLIEKSASWARNGMFEDRTVVIATEDQLTAATAMIELDGVARRIVLLPPDLPLEQLAPIAQAADADTIVTDRSSLASRIDSITVLLCDGCLEARSTDRGTPRETEWILVTSGTTGQPKMVVHTLFSLAGALPRRNDSTDEETVWSTFYDIRRYGGLQIFLRAMVSGCSLVLSDDQEPTVNFLDRAGKGGVTHISGTPSHWRRALMSSGTGLLSPRYVRLSGEIADQSILNRLRSAYPEADMSHAFASTEAGVVFNIVDGLAGFPPSVLDHTPQIEIKLKNESLHVRSLRTASRYLDDASGRLKDAEGFVDTGDMVELRESRYYFVGRRDGVINVGGRKVHPEEVEEVIKRHPEVEEALVYSRRSAITGALVAADVVLNGRHGVPRENNGEVEREILRLCRTTLAIYKVPVILNFVSALDMAGTGKLSRPIAQKS
jgi:acyl-coenzyme A synthetase/AMP-(fatty) acid ligase